MYSTFNDDVFFYFSVMYETSVVVVVVAALFSFRYQWMINLGALFFFSVLDIISYKYACVCYCCLVPTPLKIYFYIYPYNENVCFLLLLCLSVPLILIFITDLLLFFASSFPVALSEIFLFTTIISLFPIKYYTILSGKLCSHTNTTSNV